MPALFRPPLPKPCVRLSPHTALQLTRNRAGRPLASRLPPRPPAVHLLPFALWPAFPTAPVGRDPHDYYGSSVAVGLAPRRPSRLPSVIDVRARRRCPCPSPSVASLPTAHAAEGSRAGYLDALSAWPRIRRCRGERVLASLETGVQAIRPSPYRAGLAGRHHTRLLVAPAFPPCCCPPRLSLQGRVGDPEAIILRTSPRCARDR